MYPPPGIPFLGELNDFNDRKKSFDAEIKNAEIRVSAEVWHAWENQKKIKKKFQKKKFKKKFKKK